MRNATASTPTPSLGTIERTWRVTTRSSCQSAPAAGQATSATIDAIVTSRMDVPLSPSHRAVPAYHDRYCEPRQAPNRRRMLNRIFLPYPRHTQRYSRALTRASAGSLQLTRHLSMAVFWREAADAAQVWIMSRVIAVTACGFMLAACSTTMPSLDFMKSAPQAES